MKGKLTQTFRQSSTSGLHRLLGEYIATTVGRFIVMKMRVTKKDDRYYALTTVLGVPVANACLAVDEKSRVGDVQDVYYMEFTNPLMRILFCDEMRDTADGGVVGRIVVLPFGGSIPVKYFTYRRL
jgi:hypothetical protein